ncbi:MULTISPECIES: protein-disulfide reductase DsbD [unclassified Halomonas]|uniref:protein-disulfide reductase DsbD n=1 Tax=unclassified Halomonas TaxID=2609666 RepID=UPI00288827C3|nr:MULTISPECIES: protein-disulfide reductase DsbD [unclassified Halomonas]MDT0499362.1 protein-disulfide reductase DsbD [Halomonas sp. PAR7]MDT0510821.1 protein-disulfide reductase DsbD [Halomonas sp. LES1]MDT0591650.1 protein-disulfide reductase DsbD [Halomonas sp. PAR8]
MIRIQRLALTALLLLLLPIAAQGQWFSNDDSEFLPVLEAFQPSAWHDGETLYIGMEAEEEHYLYRHQFAVKSDTVALGEPDIPEGTFTSDEFLGDVYTFRDSVVFEVPLEEEASGVIPVTLTFQGCADAGLCYPPEHVDLDAAEQEAPAAFAGWQASNADSGSGSDSVENRGGDASTTAPTAPQSEDGRFQTLMAEASLPLTLGLFFIAGLGLTFTPCVLPMVPILSSIIVGQNPSRPRAFALSASYVGGMALTYALVGVLMGLFGAGLNLQAQLQSAPVLITFAVLFTIFALAMFGAFDLRLSPRLAGRIDAWQARAQQSGPAGLALTGALSVLVVSPCVTAPLAGALVFISTTGDALLGGAALLALGLGMGVPLLLVGTFGTTLLPRSGAWMNGVKIAFGILLLGVAIWLVERLLPATLVLLLWAGLAVGTAVALGAMSTNLPQGWARARQALGLLLLAWGVVLVLGAASGASDPLRPLAPLTGGAGSSPAAGTSAPQEIITVERLDQLHQALASVPDDQAAFVHFTADWCISCKQLERRVYPDPRVAEPLSEFARINVDVTDSDANSRELLERFELFGPPSLLFFRAGEEIREARILGAPNAGELASHLTGVRDWLDSGSDA